WARRRRAPASAASAPSGGSWRARSTSSTATWWWRRTETGARMRPRRASGLAADQGQAFAQQPARGRGTVGQGQAVEHPDQPAEGAAAQLAAGLVAALGHHAEHEAVVQQ